MIYGEATLHSTSRKRLLLLLHGAFLLIGIVTVLLGQILPILSRRFALDDRQAGYLFVAQFAGSLAGAFFYNRIIKKIGYLRTLAGGFCLVACGCAGLNFDAYILSSAAIFLYGVGTGLTIPAVNLLIVELNREKSSSALNTVNFFWGFGAILCKPFVDSFGSPDSILLPTFFLCAVFLLLGGAFAFLDFLTLNKNFNRNRDFSDATKSIWTTQTAWLIAIFNFVHIGIESSISGWITTYESRLAPATANSWLSAAVVFFSFLVIGRAVAPLFFRFFQDNTVLLFSLAVMSAGIVLILRADSFSFLTIGAATLGFGTSTVFPTNMSRFTKIFGSQATENATPLFVLGNLGGAFTTWLVGFASTTSGSLHTGFLVILASCILLIVLQIILTAKTFHQKTYATEDKGVL
jgi:fucose permease